jgi:DNA polymerase V
MQHTKLHGGKRPGAGRPRNSGKHGEPTQPVRVPMSLLAEVQDLVSNKGHALGRTVPLFSAGVRAGLPTAADDHVAARIDLHNHLAPNASETFLVRVQGDSMRDAGMQDGDVLVVDRSLPAKEGAIVIAALDGELTVKRLRRKGQAIELWPENEAYPVIRVQPDQECHVMGVVTNVIHPV